jgi:hypothetical protein
MSYAYAGSSSGITGVTVQTNPRRGGGGAYANTTSSMINPGAHLDDHTGGPSQMLPSIFYAVHEAQLNDPTNRQDAR